MLHLCVDQAGLQTRSPVLDHRNNEPHLVPPARDKQRDNVLRFPCQQHHQAVVANAVLGVVPCFIFHMPGFYASMSQRTLNTIPITLASQIYLFSALQLDS